MPVSAETLSKLMDAGLDGDALLDVVRSIDADMEGRKPKRSKAAERQARYRAKKAETVTRDVTSDATRDACDQKEKPPTPPKEKTPSQKKNPPKGGQKEKGSPAVEAMEVWNQVCGGAGLPKCAKLTDRRAKMIAARIAESGPDEWRKACQRVAASGFCKGGGNTGWRATIDFLATPDGFVKVTEGKYDNTTSISADQANTNRRRAAFASVLRARSEGAAGYEAEPGAGGSGAALRLVAARGDGTAQ